VPGVSDRISVRSIVGRFLEHSRIFWFANGGDPQLYISSADLMERNLDRRVEVLCPIHDRWIADHLRNVVLGAYLRDTHRVRLLRPDGTYGPSDDRLEGPPINSQDLLLEWHAAESRAHD
jgi:polyphosphate kinase